MRLAEFYILVFSCKIFPLLREQAGEWLDQGTWMQNSKLHGAHLLLPGYGDHGPTREIYQSEEMEHREIQHPNQRGFGHLAFELESVERVLDSVRQHGGTTQGVLSKQDVSGAGKLTFVHTRALEGNLLERRRWELEDD